MDRRHRWRLCDVALAAETPLDRRRSVIETGVVELLAQSHDTVLDLDRCLLR